MVNQLKKPNKLKNVTSKVKINGVMITSTWVNVSKAVIKDMAAANAYGKTTCTKAGGSEIKELVKDEKLVVRDTHTQATGNKI